jgi:hypothetical protein
MALSPSSKRNSKIKGNQITFGTIDFQPHPPILAPVFASLDQEMDLTIGSFNFRVRSLGSVRLSGPENLGPTVGKTTTAATLETSVGSSSEANSPVSIKLTKESIIEELDKVMENLDLDESSSYSDLGSDENFDESNSYSEEDFMACCGNVSSNYEDTWRSRLKLHNDENMFPSSISNHYASN